MTERAIDRMVEWLENWRIDYKKGPCSDVAHCLRKAKILAQEDKAEAPASLVEDIKKVLERESGDDGDGIRIVNVCEIESALSRYRPVDDSALVEALEKLARLGNGSEYGNSEGNRIAQEALARHKEGTPSVHKSDMSTPREQSEEMNTAPASLVEKLEKEKALIDTTNYPEDFINGYDRAIDDLKEILK